MYFVHSHFECELWIIQHVAVLLEEIMNLLPKTPEKYVKEEVGIIIIIRID